MEMDKTPQQHKNEQQKKNSWWVVGGLLAYIATFGKNVITALKFSKFAGPMISMLISIGAYALVFPIAASVGLVFMILIHELGHVWAAKRKGLPVSAPMFIPFVGALITMKRAPRDAVTEAFIAIGGPLFGTMGALIAFAIGVWTKEAVFFVAAYIGFFINLVNLLPVHPLDGGRIVTAVSRWLWIVGMIGGMFVIWYLKSWLLLIVWVYFVWTLGSKYVFKKKRYTFPFTIEVNASELREQGVSLPGKEHQRLLNFDTYSTMDGQQKVVVYWEALNVEQILLLRNQYEIEHVKVNKITYTPEDDPEDMVIHGHISGFPHENDRYYEVPMRQRIQFAVAYGGLAAVLITMLFFMQRFEFMIRV